MATTKKAAAHLAALAKADDLARQEQEDRANLDRARAQFADLQNRNQSGDRTVTGADLSSARNEVEAAEGLAAHAARMLAETRAEAAALLAEYTAQEVRKGIVLHDLDKVRQDATRAVSAALERVSESLAQRDAASDAAGKRLPLCAGMRTADSPKTPLRMYRMTTAGMP